MLELATFERSLKACLPSVKLKNSPLMMDLLKIAATYGTLYPASSYVWKFLYNLVDLFLNGDLIFTAMTS